MTVRTVGEECLTNSQRTQRQLQARLREQQGLPPTVTGQQVSKDDPLRTSSATTPASATDTDQKPRQSYGSSNSAFLDVTV